MSLALGAVKPLFAAVRACLVQHVAFSTLAPHGQAEFRGKEPRERRAILAKQGPETDGYRVTGQARPHSVPSQYPPPGPAFWGSAGSSPTRKQAGLLIYIEAGSYHHITSGKR